MVVLPLRRTLLLLMAMLLTACAGALNWDDQHQYYVVKSGDTLYSIAWVYGLDYRDIAWWNQIKPPYVLSTGRELRLDGGNHTPRGPVRSRPKSKPVPVVITTTAVKPAASAPNKPSVPPSRETRSTVRETMPARPVKPPTSGRATRRVAGHSWQWPHDNSVTHNYGAQTSKARSGVDIAGPKGDQILAAAGGEVVYAGWGLVARYGGLVIVKHDQSLFSAYAHNQDILVKEGDSVAAGEPVATLGTGPKGQQSLHFEIRKDGSGTDVLAYLPKR